MFYSPLKRTMSTKTMAAALYRLHKNLSAPPIQVLVYQQSQSRTYTTDVEEKKKQFPKVSSNVANLRRGTGGRSSFNGNVVTVFGATGFLGRAVVNQLGKSGAQVIIPYRTDPYNCLRLKLCGDLGQILFTHFFLEDQDSLYKAMKHSNIVINLLGNNFPTSNYTLKDVHATGAKNIARIAKELGVETLLHVSALNACENPKPIMLKKGSEFYRTKWEGEQAVKQEFPNAIIFRPSDMWGQGDNFLNYYMCFIRRTWRWMSLWNRGVGIIKQPVYFSDVAKGIMKALQDPDARGHTFQAIGPHRYELSELMDYFHRVMNKTYESYYYYRFDMRFDFTLWMRLLIAELVLPRDRELSWERFERECTTDVVHPDLPNLEDLGIELTTLEERIFYELKLYRAHGYLDPLLQDYVRPVEPCPLAQG